MPEAERIEILQGFKYIDYVYTFNDEDGTACDLIRKVIALYTDQKDVKIFFGNGGDRTNESTPEIEYCKKHRIETSLKKTWKEVLFSNLDFQLSSSTFQ